MPGLEFLRPFNFFFAILLAVGGYFVAGGSLSIGYTFAGVLLAAMFITIAGNYVNKLTSGNIYKLVKSSFSAKKRKNYDLQAVVIAIVLFLTGFISAYSVGINAVSVYVLILILTLVYISRAKDMQFFRSVIMGIAFSMFVILGASAYAQTNLIYVMAGLLFFPIAALDMVRTMDVENSDRMSFLVKFMEHFSSYMKFGEKETHSAAALFLAIFILGSPFPYIYGMMPMSYLVVVTFSSLAAFLALFSLVRRDKNIKPVKTEDLIRINIVLAIIAFLAGVLV
ncbi:MAG: UbiA family prenyltransferase [Candidatus Aenigmatarchaeota archaeon]